MVYQRIIANSFSEIITKMSNYASQYQSQAVEFYELFRDKRKGEWKVVATRDGSLLS